MYLSVHTCNDIASGELTLLLLRKKSRDQFPYKLKHYEITHLMKQFLLTSKINVCTRILMSIGGCDHCSHEYLIFCLCLIVCVNLLHRYQHYSVRMKFSIIMSVLLFPLAIANLKPEWFDSGEIFLYIIALQILVWKWQ